MKTASIFFALGVLIASFFSSCTSSINRSNENVVGRDVEVASFNRIKLEGAYNVTIQQGTKPSIKVSTSKNLLDNVNVYSNNNLLRVNINGKNISPEEIKLQIVVDSLKEIDIEGGVVMVSEGAIKSDELKILLKGGAHIKMELEVNDLYTRTEGGANMEFSGKTSSFTAISEGAGNIDADRMESKNVSCKVAGVGNASVYATDSLDATVEGLGNIGYRGNPVVNKKVNGIGFVHKK